MSSDPSQACPTEDEIVALALEELDEPRKAAVVAHLATCEACTAIYADHRVLVGALAEPPRMETTAPHLEAVRRAARETPQDKRHANVFTLRRAVVATTVLALAAAVVFRLGTKIDDPISRGAGNPPARLCSVEGQMCSPVVSGTKLSAESRLSLDSESRGAEKRFGLAFVVDARGEIHWVFPPWPDGPAPSPATLPMGLSQDAIRFPTIALGSAKAFVLTSEKPIGVADVEKLQTSARTETQLRATFPVARLSVVPVTIGGP